MWIIDFILEICRREKQIVYVEKDLNLENVIKFLEDLKQFRN